MSLCGQKSKYVIHSLIPSPTDRGSVRPGRRGSCKGTYKGRLNLDNEISSRFQTNDNNTFLAVSPAYLKT